MRGTGVGALLAVAAAAAVLAFAAVRALFGSFVFHWTDLLFPWALTAGCAAAARWVRRVLAEERVGQDRSQVHPLTIARLCTAGSAAAWLGAVLGGAYAGAAAWLLPRWGVLAAVAEEGPTVLVGVATGTALAAAGLWLERSCRVPPEDGDPPRLPGLAAEPR
ncbi:DUF3180 family protein [Corynebacterium sphenisci]|uniref:DUF3180 family protein n=1 Tax=Corynebacterium sphenisci TaxID=191493 RepID=UPI0009525C55|nr:DUF3180 family protein [Corynebacterium sphenisci]